jgi:long-chain acyl-CoA synthetase
MLVNELLGAARQAPDKAAVSDGRRTLTYRRMARLALVLRDVVEQKTNCPRVGMMLPASTAFPPALFGVLWAHRTAVPLNFLLHADELARVVADADIDTIITVRHFADLVEQLATAMAKERADARIKPIYLEDLPLKRKMLFAVLRSLPAPPTVEPDETAVILYTSGTTAEPKGVELTYRNLHSNCVDSIQSLAINPEQRFLNILPPFHVFGLTANVLIPVVIRSSVFAIPRFGPLAVVRAVRDQKITVMLAIPSMYAAILRTKSATAEDFASIYLAVSGGEALPDSVRVGFEERFGVTIRQGYGLTETSPVVSACSISAYKVGTVGRPIRHVQVKVVDPDGNEVPTGREGEALIRGPGVMKGYYKKPDQTRQVLSEDGWFSTGDMVRFDEDGFLSITGRVKEMLIIGGENVFPREIESVLETHPGVIQAAVIGVTDDLRGEAPVAFVMPHSDRSVSEQALREHARQSLAGYKVPRRVIIREDLPTGPTGKILKRRLRDML